MSAVQPGWERLRLTIAYDGRPFTGWQSQAHGGGVQDHLERAFAQVLGQTRRVHGSGRTDAGVHALAQIAHVDVPRGQVPLRKWPLALNAHLDPGVRVMRVRPARPTFHARYDATGKVYLYRVWNSHALHPLEIGRAWHVPGEVDAEVLRAGAALFIGTHDFSAFAANRGEPVADAVRTITRLKLVRKGELLTLEFHGAGFLYKMVRLLVGGIVRCAQGRFPLSRLEELLHRPDGRKNHYLAEAEGLFLKRVLYGLKPPYTLPAGEGEEQEE